MKLSGGISFTYIQEDEGEVTNGALAFTITVDTEGGEITIVDNKGHSYVPSDDSDH